MAKFNIEAIWHRRVGSRKTKVFSKRLFARIETAVRRCAELMILDGQVGDVIEFVLRKNSWQVGTISMKADGSMKVDWVQRKLIADVLNED